MDNMFAEKPLNLKEFRAHMRYLYETNEIVRQFLDLCVVSSVLPDSCLHLSEAQKSAALIDYWMYGWVVIDKNEPKIYDPDLINVRTIPGERGNPRLYWLDYNDRSWKDRSESYEGVDITDKVIFLRRKTSPYDVLGRPVLECLGFPPEVKEVLL